MDVVTKSISAENTFSDALSLRGDFSISIGGLSDSTLTVQRSFDGGSNWADVDTFTSAYEGNGYDAVGAQYRAGVKTGDYGSDTVVVSLRENDTGR